MMQRNPRMVAGIYQLGQVITSGPTLTIHTAYNRNTGDVVGLYVIELPPTMDEGFAQNLLQPLERRRLVQSPHVIHVYDWGIDGERAYIATGPPRGITLRQVLDMENVDLPRAMDIARQMARGLVALQAQGVVDTDLRPQLVTVDIVGTTDRVQLDDIGLRQLLKQLGYVSGQRRDDIGYLDPGYAAPESISHGMIGPWSDVYQLGLLIFEVVTGRLPFVGRNSVETGILQSTSPTPQMAQFNHDTPQALQNLVERALAKDPAQRFPNAEALLRALVAIPAPGKPPAYRGSTTLPPLSDALPAIGSTAERPTAPPGKSAGLTGEMPSMQVEEDVTLRETLVGGEKTIRRATLSNGGPAPEEEGVLAYLYFEQEGSESQRFAIKNNYVVVGRLDPKRGIAPEIDLSTVDPRMTVSRQHARIRYEKTFFYIEDLKSRNKSRLGELTLLPFKAELLQHGDVLHFGSVRLIFRVPGMKDVPGLKEQ